MGAQLKVCKGCDEPKPMADYYRAHNSPDGLAYKCKTCAKAARKEASRAERLRDPEKYDARTAASSKVWRDNNPGRYREISAKAYAKKVATEPHYPRERGLKRKYGLTVAAWDALFESQGRKCAICETDKPQGKGKWDVDHDHSTGRVRGILCAHCNRLLGAAYDNPEILQNAIHYLSLGSLVAIKEAA